MTYCAPNIIHHDKEPDCGTCDIPKRIPIEEEASVVGGLGVRHGPLHPRAFEPSEYLCAAVPASGRGW